MEEKEIINKLKEYRKKDLKYEDGRILGSMCTKPHPIVYKVVDMFLETNLGDPGLFKGTKEIENEVIKMMGNFLNNGNPFGYIVSGGTEGNLMALRTIKNIVKERKRNNPNIIISKKIHFSFDKGKNMMDLNYITVPLNKKYEMDIKFIDEIVSENEIDGIVAICGCTELGTIDNIKKISKIAYNNNIYLHVDAAFGGYVVPFMEDKYKNNDINYDFDFSLKGVSSITIDPHKMGLSVIPSGGILFRDKSFKKYNDTPSPYLTELFQSTIVGTRSGIGAASTWAVMNLLGEKGYKKIVSECMDKTQYLIKKIKEYGFQCPIKPVLNIVGIMDENPRETCALLQKYGWYVSVCKITNALRIVVMPHIDYEHIDNFIECLSSLKH